MASFTISTMALFTIGKKVKRSKPPNMTPKDKKKENKDVQ